VFLTLIAVAGFVLGIRVGIELGYRRANKRFAAQKSSGRLLGG
jgi:hypothetical protein